MIALNSFELISYQINLKFSHHSHCLKPWLKHKGYICFHVPSSRTYIARHVIFDETSFLFPKHISQPTATSSSLSDLPLHTLQTASLMKFLVTSTPSSSVQPTSAPTSPQPPPSGVSYTNHTVVESSLSPVTCHNISTSSIIFLPIQQL